MRSTCRGYFFPGSSILKIYMNTLAMLAVHREKTEGNISITIVEKEIELFFILRRKQITEAHGTVPQRMPSNTFFENCSFLSFLYHFKFSLQVCRNEAFMASTPGHIRVKRTYSRPGEG